MTLSPREWAHGEYLKEKVADAKAFIAHAEEELAALFVEAASEPEAAPEPEPEPEVEPEAEAEAEAAPVKAAAKSGK